MAPSNRSEPDPVLLAAADAAALGQRGDRPGARTQLQALWDDATDPLHRVALAHALADVQDDLHEELRWDRAALDAVGSVADDRVVEAGVPGSVRSLLPSLHLNLADVLHRLDREPEARAHLHEARAALDALPADGYRTMIAGALDRIEGSLGPALPVTDLDR